MPRLLIILSVLAATLGWSAGEVRAADPKPPPGQDPGGHAVALIAGGIDYRDPALAARLARDGEGELKGQDAPVVPVAMWDWPHESLLHYQPVQLR